ncbi:hypothetical protein OUS11_001737 [Enterococcus hirae]|nr:hypothetical protein [Enterococcus hirae]EMF0589765.1 hypothetical protein [Enterococcus faecium]
MGRINKAYCKKYGRTMSLEEISRMYDEVRHDLYCATEGCTSKMVFVRGDNPILRTFPNNQHTEECENYFEKEAKAARLAKIDSAFITLTEEDFSKKHSYLLKKFLKKEKDPQKAPISKGKRVNKNKTTDTNAEKKEYIQASLGATGSGQTKEELQKATGTIVRGPSFPAKELHQIVVEDIGTKCGVAVEVTAVRKIKDKLYEIDVIQNKVKGTLVLPEAFFTTQYVEAGNYIDALGNYIETNKKYPLFVLTYCEVERVSSGNVRLSVLDYTWLAIAVGKEPIKKLKLVTFYTLFETGAYND